MDDKLDVHGFIRNMSRLDLERFATTACDASAKYHFAAHGAITYIQEALCLLERSKGNPEDNSQLVWNGQYDEIWQSLVHALDTLKGVT